MSELQELEPGHIFQFHLSGRANRSEITKVLLIGACCDCDKLAQTEQLSRLYNVWLSLRHTSGVDIVNL